METALVCDSRCKDTNYIFGTVQLCPAMSIYVQLCPFIVLKKLAYIKKNQ